MKRFMMLFTALICAIAAANPMDFRSYKQTVKLEFASEKEAQESKLVARALPDKYVLAFTSRWDDSAMSHINTHKVMSKYGAKGNFYVGGSMETETPVLQHIIKNGCLAGAHTVGHNPMKRLTANRHFYEYMANRLSIEVKSQTPVNTQASPYGNITGDRKEGTQSIGRSLMATGIIGSPDSRSPEHLKKLGYPDKACAFAYRVAPGDRVPDLKKLESTLAQYLKMKELKDDPCISMSTHSWHTKEGLVLLDECYKRLTSHKDWWNCNQNEYAAYRYEFHNTVISKKVTGKSVTFEILRFEPFELGADVPLTFDVEGAKALSASAGELKYDGTQLKVPHAKDHVLPSKYGYKKLDGVELELTVSGIDGKLTAKIAGENGKKISDVSLTFRVSPKYKTRVFRKYSKSALESAEFVLEPIEKSYHYTVGKPYYAVQMDYTLDGKRARLYADCFGKEIKPAQKEIMDAVVLYERKKNWNGAAELSKPETKIPAEFKRLQGTKIPYCTPGSMFMGKVIPKSGYVGVVDIISRGENQYPVTVFCDKDGELYFNGEKLPKRKKLKLKFKDGRNRLVILGMRNYSHIFNIEGKVTYTPGN